MEGTQEVLLVKVNKIKQKYCKIGDSNKKSGNKNERCLN